MLGFVLPSSGSFSSVVRVLCFALVVCFFRVCVVCPFVFVCRTDALLESATAGDASGVFTSYEGLILVRTRNLPLSLYFSFSAYLPFSYLASSRFLFYRFIFVVPAGK